MSDKIKHPIIREALKLAGVHERNLEIASMADIPTGTGLGSSGGFTTALLKALHALRKNLVHPAELAEQACHIELENCANQLGNRINTLRPTAASPVSNSCPTARSRRGP